jgi:undecaprenyl-diphosphatase
MKIIETIHSCDVSVFLWVSRRKSQHILVPCARWISKSGDGYLYVLLAGWIALGADPSLSILLGSLALGFLVERPVYFMLKNLCRRERPQAALKIPSFIIPSDRFSFPSGHTSGAFLVATQLSYFFPVLVPLFLAWAVLVGVSRVILGVHFPTDTFIGALMGSVIALASLETLIQ